MDILEGQLEAELQEARARHRAIVAGTRAVQQGKDPREVAQLVREAADNTEDSQISD